MRAAKALGALLLILSAAACSRIPSLKDITSRPDELTLKRADYAALEGWAAGDVRPAFAAFATSCKKIVARKDDDKFGGADVYGTVKDWRPACSAALKTKPGDDAAARKFFETWFEPAIAANRKEEVGLFTGYYEPELKGSRKRTAKFKTPLYGRPGDLIQVDLGAFRPALKGERIAGRVDGGKLVPYLTRGDIVASGLKGKSEIIAYVDDATAAFFLQVQGSGRLRFADGKVVRVAYDGQNGHPYTAIGRVLVDRGEIKRENLSMQAIRDWLAAHPKQADSVMNTNPSYVFFKEQPLDDPTLGADGAQGVPLTPEASLAVDLRFHGLGAPMWIDANAPADATDAADVPFHRLVVAQDTGGAIRGPVRGDVYWGANARAESIAGRMAHKGKLFVLLPKPAAARLAANP